MDEEKSLPEEYEICPHCGDLLEWFDMFEIPWCYEMFFGIKKKGE